MGNIFDDNSEFRKYAKDQENDQPYEDYTELHIKEDDSYVLDLKSISAPQQDSGKRQYERETVSRAKKPKRKIGAYVWDKFKFLATTSLIFVVSFIALNWAAYSQIFYGWYLDIRGIEQTSPLNEFTEEVHAGENRFLPSVANEGRFNIPRLDIEVTPPGTRLIIPKIGSNLPIVKVSDEKLIQRDWAGLEKDIQEALRGGVIHYPGTPWFNQSGNVVITGHSSYYPWDPGRFKDVFAILHRVEIGDKIITFYKQKKYTYKVTDIKVVLPTEIEVLGDSGDDRLTLITCTPIGTNLKRLIVTAKPVS